MSANSWRLVPPSNSPALPGHVRIAGVQSNPRIGALDHNLQRTLTGIEAAAAAGARLVVFPECSLTGYCFDNPDEAREAAISPASDTFATLTAACAAHDVALVVGYLERTPTGIANTVSLISGGGPVGHYRKTHLPHLGVDRWSTPGQEAYRVYEAAGLRIGLLICFDASFPEATRLLALEGADIVLLPTNWPQEATHKASWLPNTRAYENVIYFASVNRVGTERDYRFRGLSRICDPEGLVIAQGPEDEEVILLADVDPAKAREKRIVRREGEYWLDRIGQRRTDLYTLTGPGGRG